MSPVVALFSPSFFLPCFLSLLFSARRQLIWVGEGGVLWENLHMLKDDCDNILMEGKTKTQQGGKNKQQLCEKQEKIALM